MAIDLIESGPAFFLSRPRRFGKSLLVDTFKELFEGYWASVFYSHFAALGLDIRVEDTTNKGRIDMVVLAQIKAKGYAEKYRDRGEPVHLIGVEFSRVARNLVAFDVETLSA